MSNGKLYRHLSQDVLFPTENGCSKSYGTKESTDLECDVIASDSLKPKRVSPPLPEYSDVLSKERVWTVAACSLIACLAAMVNVGMMLGFSSPALKQLKFSVSEEFQLSDTDFKYSLFGVGAQL